MNIEKYEDNDSWLDARRGRISGTVLKDIVVKRGTKPKKGFYELIAQRIAIPRDPHENVMERGHTLESEAIDRFMEITGKTVDKSLVIIARDDDKNICYSPDGFIGETESIEVKCLNSASHIEAYLTKAIPSEYEMQAIQPFCVNDKLETLYFVFFDPSMPVDFFYHTVHRADIAEKVAEYLEYQRNTLAEVERITSELLNF